MNQEWYAYIIQSKKDGTLYTGITTDIRKRLRKHNSGGGAKYTRGRGPWEYRATRMFPNKSEALKEEARLKGLSRKDKLKICLAHAMTTTACCNTKVPKTVHWLMKNFDENVERITINVDTYRELSRNNTEHLMTPIETIEDLKNAIMGTIFGIKIQMILTQKDHLTKVTFKDESIKTLCDDHGWNDGLICIHDECMIREVHDS